MEAVILLGAGALALSACSAKMDDQTRPSKAPAARVVGEARSCLPINQVSQSRVHDDRTIDFRVGSRTYRAGEALRSLMELGADEVTLVDDDGAEAGEIVHAAAGVAPLREADLKPFAGLASLADRLRAKDGSDAGEGKDAASDGTEPGGES